MVRWRCFVPCLMWDPVVKVWNNLEKVTVDGLASHDRKRAASEAPAPPFVWLFSWFICRAGDYTAGSRLCYRIAIAAISGSCLARVMGRPRTVIIQLAG